MIGGMEKGFGIKFHGLIIGFVLYMIQILLSEAQRIWEVSVTDLKVASEGFFMGSRKL